MQELGVGVTEIPGTEGWNKGTPPLRSSGSQTFTCVRIASLKPSPKRRPRPLGFTLEVLVPTVGGEGQE